MLARMGLLVPVHFVEVRQQSNPSGVNQYTSKMALKSTSLSKSDSFEDGSARKTVRRNVHTSVPFS
jgi:hypothetical protein